MSTKRAVCCNCMDGRVQIPVIEWIKSNHQFDFVDMITEPGIDGLLSKESDDISGIINKVKLSIEKNKAESVYIVGHYDCVGNPVSDDEHVKNIKESVGIVKSKLGISEVIGLWVDNHWEVKPV